MRLDLYQVLSFVICVHHHSLNLYTYECKTGVDNSTLFTKFTDIIIIYNIMLYIVG